MQMAINQMKPRRAIGVVAAPGDRRDADIQELALIAAHTFDWIIVREDDDLRGREPGEVARLIADTVSNAKPSLPLSIISDEAEATQQALDMARPGDMVVVFVDRVDATIEQVRAAARAYNQERSERFWVPVSGNPPARLRGRGEQAAQEAPAEVVAGNGAGSSSTNGSRNSRKNGNIRGTDGQPSLPQMFGDEADGTP
jgi:hypothetical protein